MLGSCAPRALRVAALAAIASLGMALWMAPSVEAQEAGDALSGFAADSDEPVHIEADELEVRDRDRLAIFTGNVVVVQGETTLRTPTLEVYYTGEAMPGEGEQPTAQGISRLKALGGVVVETDDQKATGQEAEFEMATQLVTLTGDVVLTQGDNLVRGERLVVNLESGESRLYASTQPGGGRVQGLFKPGTMRQNQE
jgi:lipopolysaccharide export system protein LptA